MSSPLAPTEGWTLVNFFWPPSGTVVSGGGSTSSGTAVALQGVTALRNTTPVKQFEIQTLLYLNTPGDGAGGPFVFQPSDSNADDGIDYVIPNSITRPTLGSWVRMQT